MATEVNCAANVLSLNGVTVVAFDTAYVTASVADDRSCVVVCVTFDDLVFENTSLVKNEGDELSKTVLLEIFPIDIALVVEDVVFDIVLERDGKLACTDTLEKLRLSRVTSAVELVRITVGTTVTCETPRVVETFATDTLGFVTGEVVILPSVLLLEVTTALVTGSDLDGDRFVPKLELRIPLEYVTFGVGRGML